MNRGHEALIMPNTKKPHLSPNECALLLGECGCEPVVRVNTGAFGKPAPEVLAEMRCDRFPNGYVAHKPLGLSRPGSGIDTIREATPAVLVRDAQLAVEDACADCPLNPANMSDPAESEPAA